MRCPVATTLLALALAAPRLAAQVARPIELGVSALSVRFRSAGMGNADAALSGVAAGGEGRLLAGPVSLTAWYLQGRLTPDTGAAPTRDLVEAGALLSLTPVSWASLSAGPRLRAYVLPAGTERWVCWEGRARVEERIIGAVVRAHLELRFALSATVNLQQAVTDERGGEAGLTVHLPGAPLWARLAYTIDRARLQGGGSETLDGVALKLGYGGR